MKIYKDLVNKILTEGVKKPSGRNVPDTLSIFGYTYQHDLDDGFPLLTTKKMSFSAIAREVCWYISGDKSIKGHDIPFWEPWVNDLGEVPSPYGFYWRHFPTTKKQSKYDQGTDQLFYVVETLRKNPYSRRLVISAWDPTNAQTSSLPPCHILQVYNFDGERLNLHLTQRSGDVPIGIPFNLAGYSLLLSVIAKVLRMKPGVFSHTIVDAHIYEDQVELIKAQVDRDEKPLPTLEFQTNIKDVFSFRPHDVTLLNYDSHSAINFPVSV